MTVAFKELAGSPVETYSPEGMRATRSLLCAWDDRQQVVEELLGDGYAFGGSTRAQYPGKPDIVAMRVRCEPLADDVTLQTLSSLTEGLNSYNGFAKVTVDYELLVPAERTDLPTIEPGTFLTYRQKSDYESLPLSGDSFTWEDEPAETVPSAAVPTIRIPIVEHRLTWHRVVTPPWQAIRTATGTLNDDSFIQAAAETVLFDGVSAQREFLRFNSLSKPELGWRIEFVFRERAVKTGSGTIVGWNHAYRSLPVGDPDWDRLLDGNNNPPYASGDFSSLFQFGTS